MNSEIQALISGLDHPDSSIRRAACQRLADCKPETISLLADAMRDPDPHASFAVASAVAKVDTPYRFELMAGALASRNPLVGDLAVKVLESYGEQAAGVLAAALPNCHPLVQIRVVGALERIGSRTVVAPLMELLASARHAALRYTIIQALGIIGDPVAVDLIRQFHDDPDYHVRERVEVALGRLGDAACCEGKGRRADV
jgi:HEAT repeat protein